MKIKSLFFLPNGNIACFNEAGEQIPELQKSGIDLWTSYAKSLGYNPDDLTEVRLPGGNAKLIKGDDGSYNWQYI